jgi:membrane-bound lytic murein transglycosylase A
MTMNLLRLSLHRLTPLLLLVIAAACAPRGATYPPGTLPAPVAPPPGANPKAGTAPATPSRATDLPIRAIAVAPPPADAALAGFVRSCPALLARDDRSGLTLAGDWAAACAAARSAVDSAAFFAANFTAVAVGDAQAGFSTGYYEPEIAGARSHLPGYDVPLYRRPADLIEIDLGNFAADLKGRKLRGRIDGKSVVPYPDRAAIMAGALTGRGLELAWAADAYEAFFLEIQGSGRLRLPDGGIMRVGYASQNGRDYVAIGRVLLDRGALQKGQVSMDSILAWLRSHPAEAPALLAANPSVVFFRELTDARADDGPIGAMGVGVTPRVSVAADPAYIPLGAPLLVETTLGGQPFSAVLVAQDTGGAIKGANRIDLFLGAGTEARALAGAQAARAQVLVLLPNAAAARLAARHAPGAATAAPQSPGAR